ncbi:MAG: M56 family metallopeptidase [Chitinophagales bacterium]
MIKMLPYIIESSICLTVCYGFYHLLLQKENTLLFNRIYLLGTVLLSIIIPFITIPIVLPDFINLASENSSKMVNTTVVAQPVITEGLPIQHTTKTISEWLFLAFTFITAIFFIRFVINVAHILYNSRKGEKVRYNNAKLVLSTSNISPHTFFKFIFLNKEDYETGVINDEVLQHEKAHCDQLHTIDILFIELVKVFFWWHPMVWMYKRSIQLNHEYMADKAVLQHINIIDYQKAILGILEKNQSLALVSHFNYYSIKKRFIMMTKMKTNNKSQLWRIWLFLPVMIGMFALTVDLNAQENGGEKEKVKKEIKIQIKEDKELSKEEIDKIIERELAKHKLDKKDVDVNVESNNGVTVISINGGKAIFLEMDDPDENESEENTHIIKIKKDGKDDVKWISKNDDVIEIEMEALEKELEFELKDLDKRIEIIQLKEEDDMQKKMEEISKRLEEIGQKKEEVMKIIEEELMKKYEMEEERIFIKKIEIEENNSKKRKKRK